MDGGAWQAAVQGVDESRTRLFHFFSTYFTEQNKVIYVKSSGEGNGTPLQYCCLENPIDGGAWLAAVHGVAKSQT